MYMSQKGATPEMAEQLDQQLSHFANLIDTTFLVQIHNILGTGTAGGIADAVLAFL